MSLKRSRTLNNYKGNDTWTAFFSLLLFAGVLLMALSILSFDNSQSPSSYSSIEEIYFENSHWTDEVQITDTFLGSRNPDIAISPSGNRHIVWSESNSLFSDIYYQVLSPSNEPVIEGKRITHTGFPSVHPQIALDSGGRAHIVWLELSRMSWDLYYVSTDTDFSLRGEPIHVLQLLDVEEDFSSIIYGGFVGSDGFEISERLRPQVSVEDGVVHIFVPVAVERNFNIYYCTIEKNQVDVLSLFSSSRGDMLNIAASSSGPEYHISWVELYHGLNTGNGRVWYSTYNVETEDKGTMVLLHEIYERSEIHLTMDSYGDSAFVSWGILPSRETREHTRIRGAIVENGSVVQKGYLTKAVSSPSQFSSVALEDGVHLIWAEDFGKYAGSTINYAFYPWNVTSVEGERLTEVLGASSSPATASFFEQPILVWEDTRDAGSNIYMKHKLEHLETREISAEEYEEAVQPSLLPLVTGFSISILSILALISDRKELLLLIPGYSRLTDAEIVGNSTRQSIMEYLEEKPGANFTNLMESLSLKNGVLSHHLRTLERSGYIRSKKDGALRRYYPSDHTVPMSIDERILYELANKPGISQSQLAENLGVTRQVVNYHVQKLCSKRKIAVRKEGKNTKCYALSLNPN